VITSESIKTIAPALLAARKAFKPALKTAENPHFKSKYVDLQSVVDATEDALNANGLMLLQSPESSEGDKMVSVTSRLIHVSGEWIEGTITLPSGNQSRYDAQTVGSAITYARRYSYMGMLGIAPEDDDGSTAAGSHVVSKPAFVQRPVTPIKTLPQMDAEARGDSYEEEAPLFDEDGNIVEHPASVQNRQQKQVDDSIPSTVPAQGPVVSEAQAKRWLAIAKVGGKSWDQINAALKAIGVKDAKAIPRNQYDNFIEWAGGKNEKRA
jgi:ERF superfamily